jgi:Ser/Thr protein kinase RdoA (MazF antagonist)
MNLNQPIALGRTAEIYAWKTGQILKLFYDWYKLEDIEYEARVARAVHASGLPVPVVGEIIRVNKRNGLVYQRVDGDSMWIGLSLSPWKVFHCAKRTAELHAEMHGSIFKGDIPPLRKKLIRKIRLAEALPADLRSKVLAALENMPDGDRLCHGDFHPDNILTTGQGEIIIDWVDASWGNPLADLARTTIILLGASDCQVRGLLRRTIVRIFHMVYLRHYFKLKPGGKNEYLRWLPIVAAARLSENISELEGWLITRTEEGLHIG